MANLYNSSFLDLKLNARKISDDVSNVHLKEMFVVEARISLEIHLTYLKKSKFHQIAKL
jgi:hypothetical protein